MKTRVTNQHDFTLGRLKSVKNFDRSKTYLKVVNRSMVHHGMTYKLGLNENCEPFNSDKGDHCCRGGLYFTTLEYLPEYGGYGTLVAEIKILEDSKLVKDGSEKYRTDKFEILKFWDMNDFLAHVGYIDIGGHATFHCLESTRGFEKLERVNGSLDLEHVRVSVEGLENLKSVGGEIDLRYLKSAKGLENLKWVGYDIKIDCLESADGFDSLEYVNGYVFARDLKSLGGFKSLTGITKYICMDNIEHTDELSYKCKKIPGHRYFYIYKSKNIIGVLRRMFWIPIYDFLCA